MEVTLKVTGDVPDDILNDIEGREHYLGLDELREMSEDPHTKSIRLTDETGTMLFIYDREERG